MPNFQKTKEYTCSMKSINLSNMYFYGFSIKKTYQLLVLQFTIYSKHLD